MIYLVGTVADLAKFKNELQMLIHKAVVEYNLAPLQVQEMLSLFEYCSVASIRMELVPDGISKSYYKLTDEDIGK